MSRIQPGDEVVITYRPKHPTETRVYAGAENAWRVPLLLGGGLALLAVMLVWCSLRELRRRRGSAA